MFHFIEKPRPPRYVGRVTSGQAVDSSAMTSAPGWRSWTTLFSSRRKAIASRCSRPAVAVGHPLAGAPRIIQVQHGGDVDAQPVDVEFLQPVEGAGEEVVAHLRPPVAID
jgi:hypothetical protein